MGTVSGEAGRLRPMNRRASMYLPSQFAETRIEALHRIVRENALGVMVRMTGAGLEADHLPFLLDADRGAQGTLVAHVARNNPVWREVDEGAAVLVVFRGAQGYVSPNWYPGKQDTHRYVPTWNYEVVHAHGTIHVHDDERFVRRVVARLTQRHEADQAVPWKMGDAPAQYLAAQLGHIVGIEIRLTRLDGKRKLNQHHEQPDREGAIRGLDAYGNHRLARAMRETALRPSEAKHAYAAIFTCAKSKYDSELREAEQAITERARSMAGFLGSEAWENSETGHRYAVYYWETLESLQQLVQHPAHVAAEQAQDRWAKEYQVTVAQVLRSYGDDGIVHPFAPR